MKIKPRNDIIKRENEYIHITNLITNLITTKNNLQIFSFTVIVTLIGIVCEFNKRINAFHEAFRIVLLAFPLLLVIAFSSVISYYKIDESRKKSFLQAYFPEAAKYYAASNYNIRYKIIDALMNSMMFILSVVCTILLIAFANFKTEHLLIAVPILIAVEIIEICIIIQGSRYGHTYSKFLRRWELSKLTNSHDVLRFAKKRNLLDEFLLGFFAKEKKKSLISHQRFPHEIYKLIFSILESEKYISQRESTKNSKKVITIKLKFKGKLIVLQKMRLYPGKLLLSKKTVYIITQNADFYSA